MASNRSNLALDEQSFQGLLAAAFTIQEHNDRANAGQDLPEPASIATPTPEPAKCNQCGTELTSRGASCPTCRDNGLRPGERLQRNWASMWLMSQDLKSNAPEENHEDFALSPADPGRVRVQATEPGDVVPTTATGRADALQVSRPKEIGSGYTRTQGSTNDSGNSNSYSSFAPEEQRGDLAAWPVGSTTAVDPDRISDTNSEEQEDKSLIPSEELLAETGKTSSESEEPVATLPVGSRLKLRFQRANLYLGIAILVAAAALLWPTGSARDPKVPMWERILIATGIAEAPTPAVHFHGDPDLKVWVDTHTALYYCPGDELYGKSPGGHYSTQRDAQSDRFEPAERSVCVE